MNLAPAQDSELLRFGNAQVTAKQAETEIRRRACETRLIPFIQQTTPFFKAEYIHYMVADYLEAVENGEMDRLIIAMPPRTGKSTMVCRRFVPWCFGKDPTRKIMICCHSTDLAKKHGRDARDVIDTPQYQAVFPGVKVSKKSSAADEWQIYRSQVDKWGEELHELEMGEFNGAGVNTGIAGMGFNIGILDDPLSEQDKDSKIIKDGIWDWYPGGFYTRRQPEQNAIIVMATRWATDDPSGHLIEEMRERADADNFDLCIIPAELDEYSRKKIIYISDRLGLGDGARKDLKEGGSFAPERFPMKELMRTKNTLPRRDWLALYQQSPIDEQGSILKKAYWRLWKERTFDHTSGEEIDNPFPKFLFKFQCYDTAFEEGEANDYSARTTWGIFEYADPKTGVTRYNVMLIEAWKAKAEFPDLVEECWNAYKKHKPDVVLIEKRASGHSLLQEMRRQNCPVEAWLPPGTRGNKGKLPRAHTSAVAFRQGAVWYPEREWAMKVIDECATFRGHDQQEYDDWTDTVTMAIIYLRRRFWLDLEGDTRAKYDPVEGESRTTFKRETKPSRGYGASRRTANQRNAH